MSMGIFAGLPGKMKELLDRVPADASTKLDRLDANISSRASTSIVAKAATWTQGLADLIVLNLDGKISEITPGQKKIQVFTADGTWIKPENVEYVLVTVVAGGGGGGGGGNYTSNYQEVKAGDGGGAGEVIKQMIVPVSGDVSVVVGLGGLAGAKTEDIATATTGDNGTDGGDSFFGALVARGGERGLACDAGNTGTTGLSPEGNGGQTESWVITQFRQHGSDGVSAVQGTNSSNGGKGGASPWGDGGIGGTSGSPNGGVPVGYGGGGAGGYAADSTSSDVGGAGSDGADGVVIVEWWEY